QVGLVASAQGYAVQLGAQPRAGLDLPPVQVGCAQQALPRHIDHAGQCQPRADDPSGLRCGSEHLGKVPAQQCEGCIGVGAHQVGLGTRLGDHVAAQVDEPGGDVGGVDL